VNLPHVLDATENRNKNTRWKAIFSNSDDDDDYKIDACPELKMIAKVKRSRRKAPHVNKQESSRKTGELVKDRKGHQPQKHST
jgi:ssDNA-binding Zn-finger/Zn-ribbon topoisomerase 1